MYIRMYVRTRACSASRLETSQPKDHGPLVLWDHLTRTKCRTSRYAHHHLTQPHHPTLHSHNLTTPHYTHNLTTPHYTHTTSPHTTLTQPHHPTLHSQPYHPTLHSQPHPTLHSHNLTPHYTHTTSPPHTTLTQPHHPTLHSHNLTTPHYTHTTSLPHTTLTQPHHPTLHSHNPTTPHYTHTTSPPHTTPTQPHHPTLHTTSPPHTITCTISPPHTTHNPTTPHYYLHNLTTPHYTHTTPPPHTALLPERAAQNSLTLTMKARDKGKVITRRITEITKSTPEQTVGSKPVDTSWSSAPIRRTSFTGPAAKNNGHSVQQLAADSPHSLYHSQAFYLDKRLSYSCSLLVGCSKGSPSAGTFAILSSGLILGMYK